MFNRYFYYFFCKLQIENFVKDRLVLWIIFYKVVYSIFIVIDFVNRDDLVSIFSYQILMVEMVNLERKECISQLLLYRVNYLLVLRCGKDRVI